MQILDYGLFIRHNIGRGIYQNLIRILHVLTIINQQDYAKAVANQLLIILYLRRVKGDNPIYGVVLEHHHCINEEAGEVSLSMLTRSIMNDTMVRNVAHISDKYARIADTHVSFANENYGDISTFHKCRTSRMECKETDEMHMKVSKFFHKILNDLEMNNHSVYSSSSAYQSAEISKLYLTPNSKFVPEFNNVDKLSALIETSKKNVKKRCVESYAVKKGSSEHEYIKRILSDKLTEHQLNSLIRPEHSDKDEAQNACEMGVESSLSDDEANVDSDDVDDIGIQRGYIDLNEMSPARRPGFGRMDSPSYNVPVYAEGRPIRERRPSRNLVQSFESESLLSKR